MVTLNNTKTQVNVSRATVNSTRREKDRKPEGSTIVCTIRAPIAGRASMAAVKAGNFVRPADVAALATIIQTAPVYVAFALPQNNMPALREALAAETATVEAIIPGETRRRQRPCLDDRKHDRCGDRHRHGPRHHAELR